MKYIRLYETVSKSEIVGIKIAFNREIFDTEYYLKTRWIWLRLMVRELVEQYLKL